MLAVFLVGGLLLLSVGAEVLIRGAVRIAQRFGLSPLVVGLTVVAFGTSAPELAVSTQAALEGNGAIAVGNVLGSNIFNVFLILGLAGLIQPLTVDESLIRREVPLVLLVTLVVWGLAISGPLGREAGVLLVLALVAVTTWQIRTSRQAAAPAATEAPGAPAPTGSLWAALIYVGIGLACLVLGAGWFVEGAIELARTLGVSEAVIAVTLVAGGTSLPELATSVLAAVRGQREIAVGNVIGSNFFNLLGVLGMSMAVGGPIHPPQQSLAVDLPAAALSAALCLPFLFTGRKLDRKESALFLGLYVAYVVLLLQRGA